MRRIIAVLAGLATLLLTLLPAPRAAADGENWAISRFDVTADVARDGTTAVTLDFDFDFGSDQGRGPYITLPLRQEMANDPDRWRMLDVVVGQVSSPSGANAEVQTQTEDGNLLIRVGNENQYFSGKQSYRIAYTIRGLIAPNQAQSGLDEVNWNVIGGAWEIPINDISATVTGPAAVSRVACFVDGDASRPCQTGTSGSTATFSQASLAKETSLQIVAGFPAGTFVGAEPRYEKRLWIGNMFPITPVTGGIAAALTAVGLGVLLRRTRRGARDEVYLGLTPGVVPAADQQATIGRGATDAPVTVQFTPPRGARPGEIGVLTDSTADNVDITATIIDLAVRGHLRIEQQQQGDEDWTFVQLQGRDQTNGYEQNVLSELFQNGPLVTTHDLRSSEYSGLMDSTRKGLYDRVTKELHWFSRDPSHARGMAILGGIALVILGVGGGFALGLVGLGLIGLAGVICGIAMIALSNRFGARTADGSAVLAQAKGFELYLTTAEADQIKFEEGIDVFSKYLPYAIVFGVAERWAKLFEELAAQGRYVADSSWYIGYGYGTLFSGGFTSSLDQLASTMSSSMQASTAASSGGSGFSGGGGFGGGGGGGW